MGVLAVPSSLTAVVHASLRVGVYEGKKSVM